MTPAHHYDEFPSRDAFEAASDFARMHSGLLWEDAKKCIWLSEQIFICLCMSFFAVKTSRSCGRYVDHPFS
ncbi:hypothetical protein F3Y22_tig00001478pilonHSYRG00529 [Hibiscus syriacus]|uniref:Transcription factor Tfb2 C-terminal domain-containing protein n=1 Tax=Hibiscus syriacus TaxID=106335 RepID=A0A6A3CUK2_HIBSY|nr:hypothetical protein F3Y22_tig00001478pilonHSYRG00529 [Hibiscus syriacus]